MSEADFHEAVQLASDVVAATQQTNFDYKSPSPILGDLWLGSGGHAKSVEQLEARNISTIINMAPAVVVTGSEFYPSNWNYNAFDAMDVEDYSISSHFEDVYNITKNSRAGKKAVFIHCSMGVSRSSSVLIAYLFTSIMNNELSVADLESFRKANQVEAQIPKHFDHQALDVLYQVIFHVICCRAIVLPNPGFRKELFTLALEFTQGIKNSKN